MIDHVFAAPKGCDLREGIAFAVEHHLDYELPTFYYPENLDDGAAQIAMYRDDLLRDFCGKLSMHGPIFDMNPVSLDAEVEKISRHRYIQAINIAKELDVRYLVFHSQFTPIYPAANAVKSWLAKTTDFWEMMIAEHLEGTNLTVIIENFLDDTPDTMNTLLNRIDSPHLKACLDTGHVNVFSQMSVTDWLDALGHQVVYIHAHNNNGYLDEHEAFDKGLLDMESFLNHLVLLPHKINLALETASREGLERSYQILKPFMKLQTEQFASKSFLI